MTSRIHIRDKEASFLLSISAGRAILYAVAGVDRGKVSAGLNTRVST